MLSHLSVTDGKEVLPSQSPLAPPKNLCFYGKGWHKSEVWKNMFWYTCVNHTKAVCYSVKIKWKNPHNFVSQWTQMKGRRKILAICCFDKSKDFEFCHSTPVFPPRLDLSYLFTQSMENVISLKNSLLSTHVPDILVICGHPGAGDSHNHPGPGPALELLWGQSQRMNKVALQVDITYNDKKISVLILVPILSEAAKPRVKVLGYKNVNVWHFCQYSKTRFHFWTV